MGVTLRAAGMTSYWDWLNLKLEATSIVGDKAVTRRGTDVLVGVIGPLELLGSFGDGRMKHGRTGGCKAGR